MQKKEHGFTFEVYDSIEDLNKEDAALLFEAIKETVHAYAPYSHFQVGAVAKLSDGKIIAGSNQENASFPVGICAERVLLSAVSSSHTSAHIDAIAISYSDENSQSNHPISPCGICRQTLLEYEQRMNHPIKLILGGKAGKIYVIPSAASLLPLAFSGNELI
jgi:cytidine deaminase